MQVLSLQGIMKCILKYILSYICILNSANKNTLTKDFSNIYLRYAMQKYCAK